MLNILYDMYYELYSRTSMYIQYDIYILHIMLAYIIIHNTSNIVSYYAIYNA